MIPCKHCNTFNSLDSTFCKRCGTGLPEAELDAARSKLETLVGEGMKALNEGRIGEAMAVAETAVVADPSMVSALTLKSALHERKGEIAEALECAERIVELNPDSELDKIKRNQLRAALVAHGTVSAPNRAVAFVAAASAVTILVCAAVFAGSMLNRRQEAPRLVSNAPEPTVPGVADRPHFDTNLQTPPSQGQNQTQTQSSPPADPKPTQNTPNVTQLPDTSTDGDDSGEKPSRSATNTTPPLEIKALPVAPVGDPDPTPLTSNAPVSRQPSSSPSPSGQTPRTGGAQDPQPVPDTPRPSTVPTPVDPGQIQITVHRSDSAMKRSTSSSAGDDGRDTSRMYATMGKNSFQIGNYSAAASQFEKALSSGGDPITINERLGQSYNSLGKKQEAISAYQRAVEACTSALSAGRGDSSKVRAVRDACETALKQIQGS